MRIRGLAKLISTLVLLCKVISIFGPGIKEFVPEDKKQDYQDALDAILAACDVLRLIDYADQNPGTGPVWGS
jgi:hypothetical protein